MAVTNLDTLGLANDVIIRTGAGVPTDGASGTGAGVDGPGSIYIDVTAKVMYVNTGTKAIPAWTPAGAGGGSSVLEVRNETGGALAANDLVYISGWDETNAKPLVTKADADVAGSRAEFVCRGAIANNANGVVFGTFRSAANLNTNAATVGDPVHLSITAAGWVLTAPAGAGATQQIVGRVAVKSTTVGVIEFNLRDLVSIGTNEIQDGALAASAAGRALIATGYFDETKVDDAFVAGAVDGADIIKIGSIGDDRMVSSLVKEPGRIAVGRADFAGAATPAITVTIGAAVYTEADAEDFPNGIWTNGASGNDGAVSLAAAINGDTRNSGGPSYAAVVLTDTVFVFALAVGTAGNVSIVVSAGEPASVENLIGGAAAAVKQIVTIQHVVTALEVAVAGTAPEVLIPLPFDPTFFSWQVYDSTGGIYATELTARGTVVVASSPVPAYFRLANNGAADVQAGDIIRLIAVE